eukprot:16428649-Heterocapsa_arctica.AAC.1
MEDTSEKLSAERQHAFRRDIGKLMWVLAERPDLSFMVRDLAGRVQGPTEHDAGRLKRLLRDVRGTTEME